jgi:hypothetical protein
MHDDDDGDGDKSVLLFEECPIHYMRLLGPGTADTWIEIILQASTEYSSTSPHCELENFKRSTLSVLIEGEQLLQTLKSNAHVAQCRPSAFLVGRWACLRVCCLRFQSNHGG